MSQNNFQNQKITRMFKEGVNVITSNRDYSQLSLAVIVICVLCILLDTLPAMLMFLISGFFLLVAIGVEKAKKNKERGSEENE